MEFPFNINNLLGSEISKLDKKVVPFRKNADGFTYMDLRSQLCTVIDKMGDASSRAQGLHGTITGGRKLQLSDHTLYIMKDANNNNNNGSGAVVGILKIGHKKLFVYDRNGGVHELEPICVLDFYVHESRQRMGCGRKLFDYMLRDVNVKPQHLAIDKPSFKFSEFLKKHYNLKAEIPQVNNFVVFEGFFNSRPNTGNGRRRLGGRPPIHPDTNFGDGEIIVQQGRSSSHYGRFKRHHHSRPNSGQLSSRSAPPNRLEEPNLRELEIPVPVGTKALEVDSLINPSDQSVHLNLQALNSTYNTRAYGAGANLYSRHVNTPPEGGRRSRPNSGSYNREGSRANSRTSGGSRTNSRTSGGSRTNQDPLRGPSPPMPQNFKEQLNLHQDYQGRGGHLKVHFSPDNLSSNLPAIENHMTPSLLPNLATNAYTSGYADRYKPIHNINWTPGAASPTHHTIGARHYSHTRLW